MKIGLILPLAAACTAAPRSSDSAELGVEPPTSSCAPVWSLGDSWTVRYRIEGVSMMKSLNPPLVFRDIDWIYTVVGITPTTVHIRAVGGRDSTWNLTFSTNGGLLMVDDPWMGELKQHDGDSPILSYYEDLQHEGVDGWPRFPVEEDFGAEGAAQTQRSRSIGSEREVVMVSAGGRDIRHVRTATQRWEPGRPWWTVMRIESETTYDGPSVTRVEIEGEVIAWP